MKNPALTQEQAQDLKFPRLMEVWDKRREISTYGIVEGINEHLLYITKGNLYWENAAEPPAELIEAMREQFAFKPQRMLVWDYDESDAVERIVLCDFGERVEKRYIVVNGSDERKYENGEPYDWSYCRNAKPLPETDPVAEEIADLKRRLAELEAKQGKP